MTNWANLTVLITEGSIPRSVGWKAPPQVFPAETCARHVYLGLHSGFDGLPRQALGHKDTQFLQGVDAYQFFVEWFVGLKNHRYVTDFHVSGQIRRSWAKQYAERPEVLRPLAPYIERIFADGKRIKSGLPSFMWQQPNIARTAVKKAALTSDSKVLVICGAPHLSVEAICALGYPKKDSPQQIAITHHDPLQMKEIQRLLQTRVGHKKLAVKLVVVPFKQAMLHAPEGATTLANANDVFVCVPMGRENANIDKEIRGTWWLRQTIDPDAGGHLFHLKGDPDFRGGSTPKWRGVIRDTHSSVTDFEQLRQLNDDRIETAKALVVQTQGIIAELAALRMAGERLHRIGYNPETGMLNIHRSRSRGLHLGTAS